MSEAIGYAVVVSQTLSGGANLSVQFNMGLGCSEVEWNAELDKLAKVIGRQEARASLEAKYNEMKAQRLVKEVITDDIERMQRQLATIAEAGKDATRRNPVNTQQVTQNVEAQKAALEKVGRTIAELEKIIADTEKKAA